MVNRIRDKFDADQWLSDLELDPGYAQFVRQIRAIATHEPQVGDWLGPYELLEEIGRGGMGRVFRARQDVLDREVAVKVLCQRTPEREARFRREIHCLGQVRHPSVVQAIEAGESRGAPYLVMELLRGRNLEQAVRESGPLEPVAAARILIQTMLGVEALTRAGLVHRDLKPSNIFVCRDGAVRLLDLGLACNRDGSSLTADGQLLGTPDFMAPECADGACDERSEVYSAGATLHFALTGSTLFPDAETNGALFAAHHRRAAPPLPALPGGAETTFQPILDRCLAKAPEDRFSAAELREALQIAVGDRQPPPVDLAALAARASLGVVFALLVALAIALPLAMAFPEDPAEEMRATPGLLGQAKRIKPPGIREVFDRVELHEYDAEEDVLSLAASHLTFLSISEIRPGHSPEYVEMKIDPFDDEPFIGFFFGLNEDETNEEWPCDMVIIRNIPNTTQLQAERRHAQAILDLRILQPEHRITEAKEKWYRAPVVLRVEFNAQGRICQVLVNGHAQPSLVDLEKDAERFPAPFGKWGIFSMRGAAKVSALKVKWR